MLKSLKIFSRKSGQVSVFVIIAAILVVIGVVYFIFSQTQIFQSPEGRSQEQISEIIEFCVNSQLDNAVKVLQFKGGRINSEPYEDQMRVESFDFDVYSWDELVTIEDMQRELEDEVENKSLSCLAQNLKGLDELYVIEGFSEENFELDIIIQENEIETIVDMPLSISLRRGGEEEVKSWEYSSISLYLPSALYTNYELAKAIYLEHYNNYVFEDLVLDQIATAKDYSNPQGSIPTVGIEFSCQTPVFRASEIKHSILSLNENNFRFLYFEDTKSIENRFLGYSDEIRDYYSKVYVKELGYLNPRVDVKDTQVRVVVPKKYTQSSDSVYLSNFREFAINGENKQTVKAHNLKFSGLIPIPCVKTYSYFYDLDYDILVEIESFENQKLEIFRLPIRIQIENSEPKRRAEFDKGIFETRESLTRNTQSVCSEESSQYPIDIYTHQVSTNGLSPLYGVDVSYECAGIICTDIGESTTISSDSNSYVKVRVPYCSRANIIAQKEGFYYANTHQKRVELGIDDWCQESSVEIDELNFEGNIPYVDVCLIKEKNISFDVLQSTIFNIETVQTVVSPKGELIVILENELLDISSFGYINFESGEQSLDITLLDVDELNLNVSVMYYENGELLSYYMFEDQKFEGVKFLETLQVTVPILSSDLQGIEGYEKIQSAYTKGFLDVNFGYRIE